jgi:hypothetical protein
MQDAQGTEDSFSHQKRTYVRIWIDNTASKSYLGITQLTKHVSYESQMDTNRMANSAVGI